MNGIGDLGHEKAAQVLNPLADEKLAWPRSAGACWVISDVPDVAIPARFCE